MNPAENLAHLLSFHTVNPSLSVVWQIYHSPVSVSYTHQMCIRDRAISKTLTKMGPMLGLMGTLIPMGPALVGLSAGDISVSYTHLSEQSIASSSLRLIAGRVKFRKNL